MGTKEFKATRKLKTCCGYQDRAVVTENGRHVTEMSYDTFVDLFDIRMPVGETKNFRVLVIEKGHILWPSEL